MKKLFSCALIACAVAALCSHGEAQTVETQTPAPQTAVAVATITVAGAVDKPGVYTFVPREKAADLLQRAGGAQDSAAVSQVYILRDGVKIPLDLSNAEPLILHEGDILVVPEKLRRIFVMGAVAKPGFFTPSDEKEISVIHALILAGGATENPKNLQIDILRGQSDGSEITVERHDWPETVDDSLFRVRLQSGDGIYVRQRRVKSDVPREGILQLLENQQK